jgi:hypothetical protein
MGQEDRDTDIILTEATIAMRRLQIEHETTYEYAETVTLLPHKLLLRPPRRA